MCKSTKTRKQKSERETDGRLSGVAGSYICSHEQMKSKLTLLHTRITSVLTSYYSELSKLSFMLVFFCFFHFCSCTFPSYPSSSAVSLNSFIHIHLVLFAHKLSVPQQQIGPAFLSFPSLFLFLALPLPSVLIAHLSYMLWL